MSHVLKLRDIVVGRCDLSATGGASHVLRAAFRPGLGWELVEPIFQLNGATGDQQPADDEHRARYRSARDTLALALFAPDGSLVETTRIDIVADPASPTRLALEADVVVR